VLPIAEVGRIILPPEYLAIGGLFTLLSSFTTAVILYLRAEIKDLKTENDKLEIKLDESNKASRDLIALQASLLRAQGVQIVPGGPQ
jgi:hypothetical protein